MGRNEEENTRKVAIANCIALEKEPRNEVRGGEGAIEQMEEDYLDVDWGIPTQPSATQFKDYLRVDPGETPRI